jgi:hypothetical protein
MKQYRVTTENLNQNSNDDCYLDPNDPINQIKVLQHLGGINAVNRLQEYKLSQQGSNVSATANENAKLMKENNIKPGTPEWFQLWFSLPYMTGEKKVGK